MTRDRRRSRAVLIGTAEYAHLPSVPAARHSLARMSAVLTSDLCGWPSSRLSVFADRARLDDLPDQLVRTFQGVTDVALFYYVGHGQIDPQDQLCLSLTQSQPEPVRRRTTSLAFEQVRHALELSQASTKIVILDCCYAGLATAGRLGAGDVLDLARAPGTYTLAAAGEFSRAWFETGASVTEPQTYFTKYLLDVIECGIPGEGPGLRLERIFDAAADALAHDGRPVPTSRATGRAPQLIFASNTAGGVITEVQDSREQPSRGRRRAEQPRVRRDNALPAVTALSLMVLFFAFGVTIDWAHAKFGSGFGGQLTAGWGLAALTALWWVRHYRRWRRALHRTPTAVANTLIVIAVIAALAVTFLGGLAANGLL